MNKENYPVIVYPIYFVLTLWVAYWLDMRLPFDAKVLGVYPMALKGIPGILLAPWVHEGLSHLYQNSLPLLLMMGALIYFYKPFALRVVVTGILSAGIFTWFLGRPAWHIGASGLVYALFGFLFFAGVLSRYYRLVALSLTLVFVYGGLVWYVFPIDYKISWEGHLGGFLGGFFTAVYVRNQLPQRVKYDWEKADYDDRQDALTQWLEEEGHFNDTESESSEDKKNLCD